MKSFLEKQHLVEDLAALGIKSGDSIMVHASLSSLGIVQGGADTVVEAMLEAVGPAGTVIMPCFRGSIRSDYYGIKACAGCRGRQFCHSNEEGETGAVSEALRKHPDALRSCHPTCPWTGAGQHAAKLLGSNILSKTPCGRGSPFFPLMEQDGKVLLLGVGIVTFTNMHAVEDAVGLPYLSAYDRPRRHATYTTSGKRIQYVYPLLLDSALKESGISKSYRTGSGLSYVMNARDIGSFLWQIVADNPWCLILRPGKKEYFPFDDACMKVSRMVRAWKNNPDREAWRKLLAKSQEDVQPPEFIPCDNPRTDCPAYGGYSRGYHRCRANDPAPWEKFNSANSDNYGITTCDNCSWPHENPLD